MRLKGEIFNFRERAGCGMSVSCPDHARIMLESTFYRRQHRSNLELAFEEVVWDFYCSRGVRNEFVTSLWLCLYSRMHVGGTVLDDFFVLQVYKAVAGTVMCEVWPRYGVVLVILCGVHCKRCFVMFVCITSIAFWISRLVCCVNFVARTILSERCLSLALNRNLTFFRCHRCADTILCKSVPQSFAFCSLGWPSLRSLVALCTP